MTPDEIAFEAFKAANPNIVWIELEGYLRITKLEKDFYDDIYRKLGIIKP